MRWRTPDLRHVEPFCPCRVSQPKPVPTYRAQENKKRKEQKTNRDRVRKREYRRTKAEEKHLGEFPKTLRNIRKMWAERQVDGIVFVDYRMHSEHLELILAGGGTTEKSWPKYLQ